VVAQVTACLESGLTTGFSLNLNQSLSTALVRDLLLHSAAPKVKELAREVLRFQRLIKRVDSFLTTARPTVLSESLDITSRTLARGLIAAIAQEPPVRDPECLTSLTLEAFCGSLRLVHSVEVKTDPVPSHPASAAATHPAHEKLFSWKLSPERGRTSERWRASTYRGMVFVRAYDAVQARELAAERFALPGKRQNSPWLVRSLVCCTRSDDATYDRVDTVSIVYP
jgi:hypothetical protein